MVFSNSLQFSFLRTDSVSCTSDQLNFAFTSFRFMSLHPTLPHPHLTSPTPHLILPHHTACHLTLPHPHLISSYLTTPHRISPNLTSPTPHPHHTSPHLNHTSPHFVLPHHTTHHTASHLTLPHPHLISPNLTSPTTHLTSPHCIVVHPCLQMILHCSMYCTPLHWSRLSHCSIIIPVHCISLLLVSSFHFKFPHSITPVMRNFQYPFSNDHFVHTFTLPSPAN